MFCQNFVCAFYSESGGYKSRKMVCTWDKPTSNHTECNFSPFTMSCSCFESLGCKCCGNDNVCFRSHRRSLSYSHNDGLYNSDRSAQLAEISRKNALIKAKQDIFNSSCSGYVKGYKISTTVNQLFRKYGKKFPEFTKDFLREAYCKSIIKYLETEE